MDSIQRPGFRLNTRYVIYGIVIWWLAMLLGYSLISFRSDRHKNRLTESGIKMTRAFSELVSLPLLEKNDQAIHSLLTDAANKKDVIYALVVDHRNKVVAFTGTGHLMPDMTDAADTVEKVSVWEGGFASHAKFLNFSSEVTYAGTKIGEIFIGLSTGETYQTRNIFLIIAGLSCLALMIFILVFRYRSTSGFLMKAFNFKRSYSAIKSTGNDSLVVCPLCRTHKPFSDRVFHRSNLERFLTIGTANDGSNTGSVAHGKRIDINDLARKKDLSWMRRQIIERCTEIIKKLAADT
ncbi:MAG: hypothetical protein WBM69_04000 [Desulfobacterales bacterium]